ncbi:hypothetical protein F5B20DRAFT_579254 [Whalleya microplaca]|nr:hypothetical protein F5B20DRAFT_579254 [Whalleya microplaca]
MSTPAYVKKQAAEPRKSRWPLSKRVSDFFSPKPAHKQDAGEVVTPDGSDAEIYKSRTLPPLHLHPPDKPTSDAAAATATTAAAAAAPNDECDASLWAQGKRKLLKHHASYQYYQRSKRERHVSLPTIDETTHQRQEHNSREHTSIYVFLQAPAHTLTMPTFRHGPIRLAKPSADGGLLEGGGPLATPTEEGTKRSFDLDVPDWTALQITAFGALEHDLVSQFEEDEADELARWWESVDAGGTGHLVGEDFVEVQTPTSFVREEDDDEETPHAAPAGFGSRRGTGMSCFSTSSGYPPTLTHSESGTEGDDEAGEWNVWSPQQQESVQELLPSAFRMYDGHDDKRDIFDMTFREHIEASP